MAFNDMGLRFENADGGVVQICGLKALGVVAEDAGYVLQAGGLDDFMSENYDLITQDYAFSDGSYYIGRRKPMKTRTITFEPVKRESGDVAKVLAAGRLKCTVVAFGQQMWQYCWLKNFKVERKKLTSDPVYTAEFAFPDPSFEAVQAKKS